VNWNLKKKIGFFAYVVAVLRAFRREPSRILVDGLVQPISGEQVLVGNGRFYGGPVVVFPNAKLSDGLLDVCVFPRVTWRTVMSCALGLVIGRLHKAGGARHFQTESFTLTAPTPTPLEIDGEKIGELPARFSIRRQLLQVLVP